MLTTRTALLSMTLTALGAGAAACADPAALEGGEAGTPEATGTSVDAIRDGRDVSLESPLWRSTVMINGGSCTGTILGPRHVLTAAHCRPQRNAGTVTFYRGGFPSADRANIRNVYMADGVFPDGSSSGGDLIDTNNKFADFAVLQLDRDVASVSADYRFARLPISWPGNNVTMLQVGIGNHDGLTNITDVMRYRSTLSYAASNAEGHVLVEAASDPGDSGGPIYTSEGGVLVVHGANYGNVWEWAWRGKYASTAFHRNRILTAMGHVRVNDWDFIGNDFATLASTSSATCATRCMQDARCNAWTLVRDPSLPAFFETGTCFLKTSTGSGGRSAPGMISGRRQSTGACRIPSGDTVCRLN